MTNVTDACCGFSCLQMVGSIPRLILAVINLVKSSRSRSRGGHRAHEVAVVCALMASLKIHLRMELALQSGYSLDLLTQKRLRYVRKQ